jgi:hypothetical protein
MNWLRRVIGYALGTAVAAALAAAVGAQATLARLPIEITVQDRLAAAERDVIGFAPTFAPLYAIAALIPFIIAAFVGRALPALRVPAFAAAGAGAVAALIPAVNTLLAGGQPVIAAARTPDGFAMLVLAGAVGGVVYALVSPRPAAR